jgi:hypothetical protein
MGFFVCLFACLLVLGFEHWALCLLGRLSTTRATPPVLFLELDIFKIGSHELFAVG